MHDNLPEVVISKSLSIENFEAVVTTKEYFIDKAIKYLRDDLLIFDEETTLTKTIIGRQHSKF